MARISKEEKDQYILHIINLYDEWIQKEEKRGASYGELYYIENLNMQELREMEKALYQELEGGKNES